MCVITIKIVQRMHFPANQYKRPREDKGHALVLLQRVTTQPCECDLCDVESNSVN